MRAEGLINLHLGCDFNLSLSGLKDALNSPTKYTIGGGKYLMVELPELLGLSAIRHQLQALLNARIAPIITHPERNLLLQSTLTEVKAWVQDGCLIQVTGQSLLGDFGKTAQLTAAYLMNHRLVHFVAKSGPLCVYSRGRLRYGISMRNLGGSVRLWKKHSCGRADAQRTAVRIR